MINIDTDILEQINKLAQQAYAEECCGVLLGKDDGSAKHVLEIIVLPNSKEDERERRYLISPEQYKAAESVANKKKLEIIGLYHSHPDHAARPSGFDLEHALPYWSYLIVAVEGGKPKAVTSWVLKDDRSRFDEEKLVVIKQKVEYHRAE
ncbi:MAG: M67 family metallopeptidase [Ignavibacteriae bacterium]|nr:M67 family metallopeptidase [Ignavibacteriota bacterium]